MLTNKSLITFHPDKGVLSKYHTHSEKNKKLRNEKTIVIKRAGDMKQKNVLLLL